MAHLPLEPEGFRGLVEASGDELEAVKEGPRAVGAPPGNLEHLDA